jgi:hypothetical protein
MAESSLSSRLSFVVIPRRLTNIADFAGKVKAGAMMKKLYGMAIALLFLAGCSGGGRLAGEADLVGLVQRSQLSQAFMAAYDSSRIQPEFIDLIQKTNADVEVIVFFGAWCSDSRREVPRFFKIEDLAGHPMHRVTLFALDRKKKSPEGREASFQIERVPTFVFLKQGKEIGRIVESPRTTLEGDMLGILAAGMKQ